MLLFHQVVSWTFLILLLPTTCFAFTADESDFLKVPSASATRESLKYITSKAHVAGTSGDFEMAEYVLNEFNKAGIPEVSYFNLLVGLNYPEEQPRLTLYDENQKRAIFEADLSEDILPQDATSDNKWRNHTFHGYSPSGTVYASMVYANYGRPQDFELLEKSGVDIKDKIVLVRYGQCFRGLKVLNAQQRGAAGVLIYSDPSDDGYGQGDVYPYGPWRSESSVQRGSVQFNSLCAGDPYRADPRYKRDLNTSLQELCGVESSRSLIPSIPSLPLSYKDATPLLENMGGPSAISVGGEDFSGGIHNLTYTVGPSIFKLKMVVKNIDKETTVPNVVGVIPGTLPPDKDMPVLLGNHRDAWIYGAADPNSGTASLLEVAKGLGKLYQNGWRPMRSIYLLSWSGEEYGLLGSTGWAELNQQLIERAVAYLNVDTVVSGDTLKVSASPSLTDLWKNVMKDFNSTGGDHCILFGNPPVGEVRDANTNWKWNDERILSAASEIGVLGSGSDYAVFLDHFGIPSLDFSFKKKAMYGQYHSVYDSFDWMDRFGGSDDRAGSSFDIMSFAAKIWGIMAMRLAATPLVPLSVIAQGEALSKYLQFLQNQNVAELELTDLELAVRHYRKVAAQLEVDCRDPLEKKVPLCNEKLGLAERKFLLKEGLPGRPWFKSFLQAPGMHLGYAAEAFPGIQQALDDKNIKVAQDQVRLATEGVNAAAEFLDSRFV